LRAHSSARAVTRSTAAPASAPTPSRDRATARTGDAFVAKYRTSGGAVVQLSTNPSKAAIVLVRPYVTFVVLLHALRGFCSAR